MSRLRVLATTAVGLVLLVGIQAQAAPAAVKIGPERVIVKTGAGRAVYRGPGGATVPAPLGQLPFFFRCGTDPFATR